MFVKLLVSSLLFVNFAIADSCGPNQHWVSIGHGHYGVTGFCQNNVPTPPSIQVAHELNITGQLAIEVSRILRSLDFKRGLLYLNKEKYTLDVGTYPREIKFLENTSHIIDLYRNLSNSHFNVSSDGSMRVHISCPENTRCTVSELYN